MNLSDMNVEWVRSRLGSRYFERRRYDAVFCSYGGSGVSMLIDFFTTRLRINAHNSENDGLKHACSPTHPALLWRRVDRAVYIYGDPAMAALSFFRRNYARHIAPKLRSERHICGADYRRYVRNNLERTTLEKALENGEDIFCVKQHWRAWQDEPAAFPIAMLKYEAIYDCLPQLFDFLGLPMSEIEAFPPKRPRRSSEAELSWRQQRQLSEIYGGLRLEMAAAPDFLVRAPG